MTTMPRRSTTLFRWLLLVGFLSYSFCQGVSSTFENETGQGESKPRVFSPRMDYDEWTPLGRGDPLKNNPTFDYVPPVLDRVQYWLDSHTTEPSSAKRDILVLGVTAKKTSPKIPEQFLKFVDGPKFARPSQDVSHRNDFTGSTGAEPPKVVRTSNFRNGPIDYRNQNRIQSVPTSYFPSPYYNQKTKPYTMMLPPPLVQKDKIVSFVEPTQQFSTQTEEGPVLQESQFFAIPAKTYNQYTSSQTKPQLQSSSKSPNKGVMISQVETIKSVYAPSSPQPTKSRYEAMTTPSISFEKSNLIYQSTQTVSGGWPGGSVPASTPTTSDISQSTWQATDYSHDQYEIDQHVPAASFNHEVVVEQNANIIVDADSNENEEVVLGQKVPTMSNGTSATIESVATNATMTSEKEESATSKSSEKMHIVVANSLGSLDAESYKAQNEPVAVVMPTNYSEKKWNASSPPAMDMSESMLSSSDGSTTTDTEMPSEKVIEAQVEPIKNSVTSSPILLEDTQSADIFPSKIVSFHHQRLHSQSVPDTLSRRPPNFVHAFGSPQAPLQSMMHPQPRPDHGTMHFFGSMRPSMSFRLPGSMSMSPPMAHMHPPPVKPIVNHMIPPVMMDQTRRPQMAGVFPNTQLSSTITAQAGDHFVDRHRPRLPDTTTSITTPTPFLPTVSSTESSLTFTSGTVNPDSESINHSVLGTILNKEKEKNFSEQDSTMTSRLTWTTSSPQVTTVPSLTTDPIFSHYKQPAKPIRGPMYLIIQGHSKVKTYKPTVSKHGVPGEKNEIAESVTERQLSKFEQFVKEKTRNSNLETLAIAERKRAEEKARIDKLAQVGQNSLMSLVESGIGSFTVPPSSSATEEDEHQANSVTTIEINGN